MENENHHGSIIDTVKELLARRKWIFILTFIPVFFIGSSVIMSLPSLYRSSTKLIAGQEEISKSFVTSTNNGEYVQRLGVIQQALLSRSQLQRIIDQFDLYPEFRIVAPPEVVIERMRRDIRIQQDVSPEQFRQNSTVQLTISYQTWNSDLAARIANELASLIQQENENIRNLQASRTTEFLRQQLNEVDMKMTEQESLLMEFQAQNLNYLPQQQNVNMAILQRLNSDLKVNGERQIQLLNLQNQMFAGSGLNGITREISPQERLLMMRNELVELSNRFTDSYPEIIRLKREIALLEQETSSDGEGNNTPALNNLNSYSQGGQNVLKIDAQLARLGDEANTLVSQIQDIQQRIEYAPRVEQELVQMTSDYNEIREEYASLQKRYQDASIMESLETQEHQQVKVLEIAIPPAFPVEPARQKWLVMIFAFSVMMSGGLVFFVEQLDTSFHSTQDLRHFVRVPLMGNLVEITSKNDVWNQRMKLFGGLCVVLGVTLLMSVIASQLSQNAIGIVWQMADRGM